MHRTTGSRDRQGRWARVLSELSPQYRSVCPETSALDHQERSWKPREEALLCPAEPHSHFGSPKVSDGEWDTSHAPKYTNSQMHRGDSPLQQALIKLCSWALLPLSPRDWCLASLALTNTD